MCTRVRVRTQTLYTFGGPSSAQLRHALATVTDGPHYTHRLLTSYEPANDVEQESGGGIQRALTVGCFSGKVEKCIRKNVPCVLTLANPCP